MQSEDYSFLFDPPKDSNVFTRTLYYPRSPTIPKPASPATSSSSRISEEEADTIRASLGADHRHAAALSKFSTGAFSSSSAASKTVAPFLNDHIPQQVHIPDGRGMNKPDNERQRVYCYRHQPDVRCQRRTPQQETVAEIQKVFRSTLVLYDGF